MRIGGLQKLTLLDYPGRIAAIIFTQGCNFRCPYCHNPELVDPVLFRASTPEDDILRFLRTRTSKLQGVVITGGEPTIHQDLPLFLRSVKNLGLLIKLDTNGSNPVLLENLLSEKLIDYCAMDLKAPLARYAVIARGSFKVASIKDSMTLLEKSGIQHEFRMTYTESLFTAQDVLSTARLIRDGSTFHIQRFRKKRTLDGESAHWMEPSEESLESLRSLIREAGINCEIR